MEVAARQAKSGQFAKLLEALDAGMLRSAERIVNALHPAEIARLLESLPTPQRKLVWEFVDPAIEGEVLLETSEIVRHSLIAEMGADELAAAAETLEVDDLADLLQSLPEAVNQQLLRSMDAQERERLAAVLSYPEDSAGGLMNTDAVSVRGDVSIEVVLRYLRMRGELPDKTDRLFVTDRSNRYLGTVTLTRLLTENPERIVADCLETEAPRIDPLMSAHDVAQLFQERDLVSAAVVDQNGRLLGRITIDDVVDVIREEAEHSVRSMAGLDDEEDVYAPILPSTRRRLLWLGVNLATASLAASVVRTFEGTIEKVAALAALMPVVASMGGIAGTQTVTLIIRGLALGQVQWPASRWLLMKEIAVGGLNGLIWAVAIGLVVWVWFGTWKIAAILAAALIVNLLAAGTVGVLIPLTLRRLRIDPALSAGVILTTFTDCIGFATLLGLGTLFLI
ncbi:MAG: magnesium transporter [Steroidobacteraceae bacterium]|nr:magnesium transporter [Steroidobacteraceae bacterium]MDW8257914.1 magnesium transporter [Gammaproteobacteria bacterium]